MSLRCASSLLQLTAFLHTYSFSPLEFLDYAVAIARANIHHGDRNNILVNRLSPSFSLSLSIVLYN